uniref:F-box domain-containing protein n=1 Tax=Lactuca sativa TaxID=4236 RepID=A0A9R1VBB4_LACSA|nr:hypothetical protein LSAT_V11C500256910 [Lactuca sativa]
MRMLIPCLKLLIIFYFAVTGKDKTSGMTRSQNHDDASSNNKRIMKSGAAPWSNLNHDVLFLVMMKLGVIDFLAFCGVCKSWRSLSLSNKNMFIASKPPMLMCISTRANEKECCLEDFEERKFKTIIPHSEGRTYFGLTCGYLIFYGRETWDFWLVNPITIHELHFPYFPSYLYSNGSSFSAILVFSSSISRYVFVILQRFTSKIWFSIEGKGDWNDVSSSLCICDMHAFKGKIYALSYTAYGSPTWEVIHLCEMRLDPENKLTLLKARNFLLPEAYYTKFVSSGENLYVMENRSNYSSYKVHELDFGEMKWVPSEDTSDEYEFFISALEPASAAVKQESWVDTQSRYKRYDIIDNSEKGRFFIANLWYFPHQCLNVDRVH